MSALMIATIVVRNPEKLKEYLSRTQAVAAPFGAELVARGQARRVLNGHAAGEHLVVVVRFADHERLEQWFDSSDYQALVPLREEAAEITMVSYDLASR